MPLWHILFVSEPTDSHQLKRYYALPTAYLLFGQGLDVFLCFLLSLFLSLFICYFEAYLNMMRTSVVVCGDWYLQT